MKKTIIAILMIGCGSAFAASQHPDLQVYERLGNPQLFQQRISYGFAQVAQSASILPTSLQMIDLTAKIKGQTVSDAEKKAAACALLGMLGQQIASEVYKYTIDPAGWASPDQKTAGQAIFKKASEATSFCSLAGGKDETPATSLDQALDRVSQIQSIASSVR